MKSFSKESASKGMRKISDSLHGPSFEGIIQGVKRVSKEQPLLMAGGVLFTGLLVARMFKIGNDTNGGRKGHGLSDWDRKGEGDRVLDRDLHSPVSVMPEGQKQPSYTYNAEKSEPYDPHMSDKNPVGSDTGKINTENDALGRDKTGKVSVTYEGRRSNLSQTAGSDQDQPGGQRKEQQTSGALERDQPGPVSVSPVGQDHPSYTHNADKSEPLDPNMSDEPLSTTRKDSLKDNEARY